MALAGLALFGYVGGLMAGGVVLLISGLDAVYATYLATACAIAAPAYAVGKVWHDGRIADRARIGHLTKEVARLQEREVERLRQEREAS
jgi:hypothetical protein